MKIILSIFLIVVVHNGLPKQIQKKVNKEITTVFEVTDFELQHRSFDQSVLNTLPAEFGERNFFQIKTGEHNIGYAYIGVAPSKTDRFDYMLLFDTELNILKSKVLIYREDHGGEIGSKRWLKQFNGKGFKDTMIVHENIMAISGATISVNSMTNAVNKVLQSVNILYSKDLL
ncbi:MAG: FMN-binding protein [Bacteroidia bacterium]|nr:FMN-binding protein [Bacteroidia bacterium]NND26373.1 FMN-binding protein [Flavobacteriaceae bacterium]MBT8278495.1 FMN-binding protein [Bacteroidia bacterium]NNK60224.1 FMN-binding protein [Flavobacteriaceae bacterium]NNL31687.1 FMN-binding protein [Flavobacteriaceae bacterium]